MIAKILKAPDFYPLEIVCNRPGMAGREALQNELVEYDIDREQLAIFKTKPVTVTYEYNGRLCRIHVDRLWTDLASIPKIPIVYAKLKLLCPQAAITHDTAFVLNTDGDNGHSLYYVDNVQQNNRVPFDECNDLFHALLLYYGVNKLTAWTMYQAVHQFGHSHYDQHKEIAHD